MIVDSTNPRIMADNIRELAKNGGGGGSDLPEVTSADNGKVLGVVEGSWNKMDAPSGVIDYSTTEQNTGRKWIDGKDIYVKTFTGNIPAVSSSITLVSEADILVESNGTYEKGDDTWPFSFPFSANSITAVKTINNRIVLYNEIPSIVGNNFTVTVYYTKTTTTRKRKTTKGEN